jgi:hypothetical protein
MEVEDAFSALKSLKNRVVRMNEWDMYAQMNTRLASPILYDLPEYPRKKIRGAGRVALFLSLLQTRPFNVLALPNNRNS